jgi:hypothetical protein
LIEEREAKSTTEARTVFVRSVVNPLIDNINYMSEKSGEVQSYVLERGAEANIYVKEEIKKFGEITRVQFDSTVEIIKSAAAGK